MLSTMPVQNPNPTARAEAVIEIKAQQGLTNKPVNTWTYEERAKYNQALASYITVNADLFNGAEVTGANAVLSKGFDPLDETSIVGNLAAFGDAFLVEAQDKLEIGGGVLTKAIYIAVIGAVAAYFVPVAINNFRKSK